MLLSRPREESTPWSRNPRTISGELLDVGRFIDDVDLLAGDVIEFEAHAAFSDGKNEAENLWLAPLAPDDPWPKNPTPIERTRRDLSAAADGPLTFDDDMHCGDAARSRTRPGLRRRRYGRGRAGKLGSTCSAIRRRSRRMSYPTGCGGASGVGLALCAFCFHARDRTPSAAPTCTPSIRSFPTTSRATRRASSSRR